MTTSARRLTAPTLWSQPRAVRHTAQGSHAFDEADAANDAASGFNGQRIAIDRTAGGKFYGFIHPATTGRFFEVALLVGWNGTYSAPDAVSVDLSVTDGTTTVTSPDMEIPRAFQGSAYPAHWPGTGSAGGRTDAMARVVGHLDRDALVLAGLSATVPWRVKFDIVCGATVYAEAIEFVELPRFAIDSTEDFGAEPRAYQPRAIVTDALSRIVATTEAAYDLCRRTYHMLSLPEAAPDVVTATSWAVIPGTQTLTGSTAAAWKVRPRRIKGDPAVLFGVRYKTSSTGGGAVRITTAKGTYSLTLPGTSGAWADVLTGAGFLLNGASDTITWEAQRVDADFKIIAYWVVDAPAP